ncbi:alpha/beta hydrolase [Solihabitans fulvus]|uniref:Alpha/beta hydrolase n=1 Tax=Solihabitans fulvus TaxID=1892852 RepID=A0A5B2XS95_9PSEU|nr:alpha/beta hydrolase [Solihabitans fulvus]KAA2265729.1 alpha/beta hydrolase [Solihabitans fulvus]
MPPTPEITEHVLTTPTHTTRYLAAGPQDGPPLVFVHGWPAQASTWRHQLTHFAALGHRAIAPDLRGYGGSTVHTVPEAYAQEHVVGDMLALLDHLGHRAAVWVGHDWGSATVWNIASHHPDRCVAVANLCVPYRTLEHGLPTLVSLVDRHRYPAAEYPTGQFDYFTQHVDHPDTVAAVFDAEPANTVRALYRRGNPAGRDAVFRTATVTRDGGWFGGAPSAPDVPLDPAVLTEDDLAELTESLARNGFTGPDSYYRNDAANAAYAALAGNGGYLDLPVLFVEATYDYVCDTATSDLALPMRQYCRDLTERSVDAGHWVAQERPEEVNAALAQWLTERVPG